jgi:2-succinyl-5-enolpyruvyl-6-hydroxy-3-cyclohexene-1-carboxylate synthase
MERGDIALACATALIEKLADGGVRHACISPGSRSTPLALAVSREERMRVHVHLDERSGGFFAVGLAKATGEPVAIITTSGTAAAELFPSIIEASQARVPVVALTADRPPHLRGTGANQTIDQVNLYGSYVRAYLEQSVPSNEVIDTVRWADAGRDAVAMAIADTGPVHINCPFDEPLVPGVTDGRTWGSGEMHPFVGGIADDEPSESENGSVWPEVERFIARYGDRKGLITIGGVRPPETLSLLSLGNLLGWPVIAEPLSGLRLDAGDAGRALAAGQALIGNEGWLQRHQPEVVLQIGAMPTTRATQALVAAARALVVLDDDHLDPDPRGSAESRIAVDPERFAATAWDDHERPTTTPPDWAETWRAADLVARATIDRELDRWDEPFEGRVARDVASFLPHGATLVVGSSTPIRDLDTFMAPRRPPRIWNAPDLLRVIGNRGASGIDGLVSTALGAAAGSPGPTVALLGDLSFLYDAGALMWSSRLGVDAVFVVLANGGGQIFSMLDQASLPEFEDLFLTPHPASIATVCGAAGADQQLVARAGDLTTALERAIRNGGVQVIEVAIDAERDRARRNELRELVHEALASR